MNYRTRFITGSQTLRNGALGRLYSGELALSLATVGCLILEFNRQVSSDGMSYYAVHRKTIPVLLLGLVTSVAFFIRAARGFDGHPVGHQIAVSLRVFAIAGVALFVTPYSFNEHFDLAHKTIGTSLFLWQLGLTIYWGSKRLGVVFWLAIALELIGGLIALFSLPHDSLGYQFEGQLLFQIGFFALLNHVSKETAQDRGWL